MFLVKHFQAKSNTSQIKIDFLLQKQINPFVKNCLKTPIKEKKKRVSSLNKNRTHILLQNSVLFAL